jgi:hypothetical protein
MNTDACLICFWYAWVYRRCVLDDLWLLFIFDWHWDLHRLNREPIVFPVHVSSHDDLCRTRLSSKNPMSIDWMLFMPYGIQKDVMSRTRNERTSILSYVKQQRIFSSRQGSNYVYTYRMLLTCHISRMTNDRRPWTISNMLISITSY